MGERAPWIVELYDRPDGTSPVVEFIEVNTPCAGTSISVHSAETCCKKEWSDGLYRVP